MMTVEMDWDETAITVLDTEGELEDVSALLYDDYCHIRQWNEEIGGFEVITLTAQMYFKLMTAWKLPTGAYTIDTSR
jgi:hypothetical protein